MKIRLVVSELIQTLRGTAGQTDMTKLRGAFVTTQTRLKPNMWNVNLPFFFPYGHET